MRVSVRNRGFTYIGLIIMVAIIGVVSTASLQVGSIMQRRAAEEALLDIGVEFRDAFLSYAAATPAGQTTMPQKLEDLLLDPRYPSPRRHLRKLYVDPITGVAAWGAVSAPSMVGEGLIGVHSLSDAAPIKVGNFEEPFLDFQGKKSYRDWKFAIPAPTKNVTSPEPAPQSSRSAVPSSSRPGVAPPSAPVSTPMAAPGSAPGALRFGAPAVPAAGKK